MDHDVEKVEIALLNEVNKQFSADDFNGIVDVDIISVINNIIAGNHSLLCEVTFLRELFNVDLENFENDSAATLANILIEKVKYYLESHVSEEDKSLRHLIVLLFAINNLKLFIEQNWVGPSLPFSPLWQNSPELLKRSDELIRSWMVTDGEDVNVVASHLVHHFVAFVILSHYEQQLSIHCKTSKFWLLRCLWSKQFLYKERLQSLKSEIYRIICEEKNNPLFSDHLQNRISFLQFHIEACHACYFYYDSSLAGEHMNNVQEASGLLVNLEGVLGKRTRYQKSTFSQLVLRVERLSAHVNDNFTDPVLPKNVSLEDEAVLDRIQFEDPQSLVSDLSAIEQCFIMGLCYKHRRSKEGHGSIVREESMAYMNCVLSQPNSWCVEASALHARCLWEDEGSRYLYRSLSQLEELAKQYRNPSTAAVNRLRWVFPSNLQPHWVIKHDWGMLMKSLNLVNAALEVFQELQLWGEVIRCHTALKNKDKAEVLIRSQLEIKETPLLLCYLGDVTRDEECYRRAWYLSSKRFSRAQTSLGYWHVSRQEIKEALECFENSLEINPMQVDLWFDYGCYCCSAGRFLKAAVAFRRCVNFDSNNSKAWCNLASAYIRSNDKPRAFSVLQEALKCDHENWKIWENYLLVSVDIRRFEETMRAYHKIIDLKGQLIDLDVLRILKRVVCEDIESLTGQSGWSLKKKVLELFGRVSAKVTNDADVWSLYAEVVSHSVDREEINKQTREKALDFHQRSIRCCKSQDVNWNRVPEKCIDVCKRTLTLSTAYKSYIDILSGDDERSRNISSAKLFINAIILSIKQTMCDFHPGDELDTLKELMEHLEVNLEDILKLRQ